MVSDLEIITKSTFQIIKNVITLDLTISHNSHNFVLQVNTQYTFISIDGGYLASKFWVMIETNVIRNTRCNRTKWWALLNVFKFYYFRSDWGKHTNCPKLVRKLFPHLQPPQSTNIKVSSMLKTFHTTDLWGLDKSKLPHLHSLQQGIVSCFGTNRIIASEISRVIVWEKKIQA